MVCNPEDRLEMEFLGSDVSEEYLREVVNTFLRVDSIISTISDLKELLNLIMMESKELVNADSSSLMLFDAETRELYFEVALGPKGDEVKEIRLGLDQGIAGYSAREEVSVNVPDAQTDPRFMNRADKQSGYITRSIVAVPMKRKGRLIGIIEVLNKKGGGAFSDMDVKSLEVLAHLAAIAIENARLFESNIEAERMAALGQAIAGMAHCVKNILTGMQGSSSLMEMAIKEKKYDILPKAWDILKKSSGRVTTLVQNMLAYSKDRRPQRVACDINQMVQDMCDMQRQAAAQEEITLKMDLDPNVGCVLLDQHAIERCIQNLIVNAIDAISESKIDRDFDGIVTVRTKSIEDGAKCVVSVGDNGCGIPEEQMAKIWGAFYSTKGSGGTGLGLSVTAKIVQEHGGKIDVKSKVGEGTTFILTFPTTATEEEGEAEVE